MLWAASCMCFFGFLRSGEIVVPSDGAYDPSAHLSYGDVRTDSLVNPSYITVAIKASKTDPFRKGVTVHIGATKSQLCPVAAVLAYMVQRGSQAGPFFLFEDGRRLTRDRLVAEVRRALERAGVDPSHYSGQWGSQFQDRSSDYGSSMWSARLPDQDTGEVGECSVHGLHPNPSIPVAFSSGKTDCPPGRFGAVVM